jgi:hypothetical protein
MIENSTPVAPSSDDTNAFAKGERLFMVGAFGRQGSERTLSETDRDA